MKAIIAESYGGPDVFKLSENASKPNPQKGQVLIEVHAAGVNPFDINLLSGVMQKMIPLSFPLIPGGDYAGVVSAVGEGVTDFKKGDAVYGTAIVLSGGTGSYAEYSIAVLKKVSPKPKSLSFTEAAALPVAGLTAAEAILDHAKLKTGHNILIHGGAGGVGHYAVQLAKSIGAYVISTAGADDIEFVKTLGADEVIDYKNQDFSELVKDLDAVIDVIGGEVNKKSYTILRPGGILITTKGQSDTDLEKKYNVTTVKQNTNTDAPALARLTELVNAGKLKPHIDKVFDLEDAGKAWIHLKSGHPRGKIVINVNK